MLPEFLVRTQREDVEEKPPNYYEILGVSPLVADKTLKQLRGMYAIDLHPVSEQPHGICLVFP